MRLAGGGGHLGDGLREVGEGDIVELHERALPVAERESGTFLHKVVL